MPYITKDKRKPLDEWLLSGPAFFDAGELNYVITNLIKNAWENEPRYTTIAVLTGVLENVKQEFYRRVASQYEDQKIEENGDVY